MESRDISIDGEFYSLGDLVERVLAFDRANWMDITVNSGIYCVYISDIDKISFSDTAGTAKHAQLESPKNLHLKLNRILDEAWTYILYIGKGGSLRKRVSSLARFGAGKAQNHHGGEWMWQIDQINTAMVLVQSCPSGKEVGFEKCLLDHFRLSHGDWPLANRQGGDGEEWWCHPNLCSQLMSD